LAEETAPPPLVARAVAAPLNDPEREFRIALWRALLMARMIALVGLAMLGTWTYLSVSVGGFSTLGWFYGPFFFGLFWSLGLGASLPLIGAGWFFWKSAARVAASHSVSIRFVQSHKSIKPKPRPADQRPPRPKTFKEGWARDMRNAKGNWSLIWGNPHRNLILFLWLVNMPISYAIISNLTRTNQGQVFLQLFGYPWGLAVFMALLAYGAASFVLALTAAHLFIPAERLRRKEAAFVASQSAAVAARPP
jgi:hypothetical protein